MTRCESEIKALWWKDNQTPVTYSWPKKVYFETARIWSWRGQRPGRPVSTLVCCSLMFLLWGEVLWHLWVWPRTSVTLETLHSVSSCLSEGLGSSPQWIENRVWRRERDVSKVTLCLSVRVGEFLTRQRQFPFLTNNHNPITPLTPPPRPAPSCFCFSFNSCETDMRGGGGGSSLTFTFITGVFFLQPYLPLWHGPSVVPVWYLLLWKCWRAFTWTQQHFHTCFHWCFLFLFFVLSP